MRRQTRDNLVLQKNAADRRHQVSADQIEQGRFARAIRSNQGVALALHDGQIDVADHRSIAETLLHSAQLKYTGGHAWNPFSRAPMCASSQAFATHLQVRRARTDPPPTSAAARSQINGLAALKCTPKTFALASSPALTVCRATISIARTSPAIMVNVGTRATR